MATWNIAKKREMYRQMLDSFRENPDNESEVARQCKVSRGLTRKVWNDGWGPDFPSIRSEIEREKKEAQHKLVLEKASALATEEDLRLQARQEAIDARAQEAQGAKSVRANAMVMAAVTGKMLQAAYRVAQELDRRTENPAELEGMTLEQLRRLVFMVGQYGQRAAETMRIALDVQRIVSGEPIAILGIRTDQMTPEQMRNELFGMMNLLEQTGAWTGVAPEVSVLADVQSGANAGEQDSRSSE